MPGTFHIFWKLPTAHLGNWSKPSRLLFQGENYASEPMSCFVLAQHWPEALPPNCWTLWVS